MDFDTFYSRNAAAFLDVRRLRMADLHGMAATQYEDAASVLLTSSVVHGVANVCSDIDLICIRHGDAADTAMATQLHCGDAHVEVIAFSDAQLRQTEAALRDMADAPLAVQATGYRDWSRRVPIPRKYVERTATGVDVHATAPYLALQPLVGRVWAAAGADQARQCAVFCLLACRSGERRAAVGYAVNALLFAMNAVLSTLPWPLLNKKWTLKRWQMAASLFPDAPLLSQLGPGITSAWRAASCRMGAELGAADAEQVFQRVDELVAALAGSAPAAAVPTSVAALRPNLAFAALLPGARVVCDTARGRSSLLPDSPTEPLPETSAAALLALSPRDAAFWLGAARAGLASFYLG